MGGEYLPSSMLRCINDEKGTSHPLSNCNSSAFQSCFQKWSIHDIYPSVNDYKHLVVRCFVFGQRQQRCWRIIVTSTCLRLNTRTSFSRFVRRDKLYREKLFRGNQFPSKTGNPLYQSPRCFLIHIQMHSVFRIENGHVGIYKALITWGNAKSWRSSRNDK